MRGSIKFVISMGKFCNPGSKRFGSRNFELRSEVKIPPYLLLLAAAAVAEFSSLRLTADIVYTAC